VSVAVLVITQQLILYRQANERIRKEVIERQKAFIKDLIAIEIEYVGKQKEAFDEEIAHKLADNVRTASQLATDLYSNYHEKMTEEGLKKLIVDAIASLRSFSPYAHIFINTTDGTGVYYQGRSEFAGRNLWDFTDSSGNAVVRSEIDLIKSEGEGFINYQHKSDSIKRDSNDKVCFVKEFKPFNWYFGAKCYLDDYYDDFKMEIARKISSERFSYGGYIFINELEGTPVVMDGTIYDGNFNFWDGSDPKKLEIFKKQVKAAMNDDEGGFFRYEWNKIGSDVDVPKLSYVRYFEPTKWLIGAGLYIDDVERDIASQSEELQKGITGNIFQVILLLLLAVGIESYFLYRFNFNFKMDFSAFNRFFSTGKGAYKKIDVAKIHFQEFYDMGVAANKLIDARLHVYNQLVEEQKKAQESDRLKTAFLANMSHEIRTPMNAILGFSELLDDEELEPEVRQGFVHLIRRNGQMLMTLINDIIDVAKIESGQMSVTKDWFGLKEMLDDLQSHFTHVLESDPEKAVRFEMKSNIPDDYQCYSDAFRLKQVLYNLIGNAVKFTHEGSIEVETELRDSRLYFTVTDTGIGISKEDLLTVFERFMQAGNHQAKNFGGTGLGLAISKNIVGLLGGEIQVESAESKGSKFRFYIPVE
jgi:signal transduction histidine kinase